MMRALIRGAAARVAVAAGAGALAAGMPAAAGTAGAEPAAARVLAAGPGAAVMSGTWGTAKEVPGTASLNAGGSAAVSSVSCASAGNCSAAGAYVDGAGHQQVFVVTQTNGTWGKAVQVPGLASFNTNVATAVTSVSCASAGDCSAGGSYQDRGGHLQAFVVTQTHGAWGKARQVPGMTSLNVGGFAAIRSVSCASAGNCGAAGSYRDSDGREQAFAVTQINGIWGTAAEVPGTASLNAGGIAGVNSVSCASAGNCSAGGDYLNHAGRQQAFVVTQAQGTWGKAKEAPGTAALNVDGGASVASVSCASAGNCSAGGYYDDGTGHQQAFVITQTRGTWGTAKEVPGTASLNTGGFAAITSVSCAAVNRCSAGGWYADTANRLQAVVVTER